MYLGLTWPVICQAQTTAKRKTPQPRDVTVGCIAANFESSKGNFSIHFPCPGLPKTYLISGDPSVEKPDVIGFYVESNAGTYWVRYADYNLMGATDIGEPQRRGILELAQRSYIEGLKSNNTSVELLTKGDVDWHGQLGLQMVLKSDQYLFWVTSLFVDQRLFQIGFSLKSSTEDTAAQIALGNREASRFFATFKVVKPQNNVR